MLNPTANISNRINTATNTNSSTKNSELSSDDGIASRLLNRKTELDQLRENPSNLENLLGSSHQEGPMVLGYAPPEVPYETFIPLDPNFVPSPNNNNTDFQSSASNHTSVPLYESGPQITSADLAAVITELLNTHPGLQNQISVENEMMYLQPQGDNIMRSSNESLNNSKFEIPLDSINGINVRNQQSNNYSTKDFSIISELKPGISINSNDDGSATIEIGLGFGSSINLTFVPDQSFSDSIGDAFYNGVYAGTSAGVAVGSLTAPTAPVSGTTAFGLGFGMAFGGSMVQSTTLTDLTYTPSYLSTIFGGDSNSSTSGDPTSGSSDSDSGNNTDGFTGGGGATANVSTSDSDNDGQSDSVVISEPNSSDGSTTFTAVNLGSGIATETVLSADGFDTSYVVGEGASVFTESNENGDLESVTLSVPSESNGTTTNTTIDVESNTVTETVTESDDDEEGNSSNTSNGNGNTNGGSTNTGNTNGGNSNSGGSSSDNDSSSGSGSNNTNNQPAPQYPGFGDGGV